MWWKPNKAKLWVSEDIVAVTGLLEKVPAAWDDPDCPKLGALFETNGLYEGVDDDDVEDEDDVDDDDEDDDDLSLSFSPLPDIFGLSKNLCFSRVNPLATYFFLTKSVELNNRVSKPYKDKSINLR